MRLVGTRTGQRRHRRYLDFDAAPASRPAVTVAHQLATVGNCGGGAYKPATLLITSASAMPPGAMATGVTWQSWSATTASGSGTVHLVAHGQPAAPRAALTLADVERRVDRSAVHAPDGHVDRESPDGNPSHVYHLQLQP